VNEGDPYNLERFVKAQDENYAEALRELEGGQKKSHWIWYVFPQVAGLGQSLISKEYAIRSRDEAVAYLDHVVLGARLRRCCETLLKHEGKSIQNIMGSPDDLKLRSSMTLFGLIAGSDSVFERVLNVFFAGQMDEKTIAFLKGNG
jgi:uncharacterized protein (DUF1810 family)